MKLSINVPECVLDSLKYAARNHRLHYESLPSSPCIMVLLPVYILHSILEGEVINDTDGDSYHSADMVYRDITHKAE